jgi:integrase
VPTYRWMFRSRHVGVLRKGKRVGLHAFRHTLASMLLQNVAVAQRQLRHSDASTTLGHYEHILGNDHREAVEAIESEFSCTGFVKARLRLAHFNG